MPSGGRESPGPTRPCFVMLAVIGVGEAAAAEGGATRERRGAPPLARTSGGTQRVPPTGGSSRCCPPDLAGREGRRPATRFLASRVHARAATRERRGAPPPSQELREARSACLPRGVVPRVARRTSQVERDGAPPPGSSRHGSTRARQPGNGGGPPPLARTSGGTQRVPPTGGSSRCCPPDLAGREGRRPATRFLASRVHARAATRERRGAPPPLARTSGRHAARASHGG